MALEQKSYFDILSSFFTKTNLGGGSGGGGGDGVGTVTTAAAAATALAFAFAFAGIRKIETRLLKKRV